MHKKYSVFVSYRRTGFDTANLIAEKLRAKGYSVFFDVESLRSGKFNEQLFQVIDDCKDFVLILPENALDRCNDKDDWVRKEVTYAMLKGKNIVPVMLSGFTWPDPMPDGMSELKEYQAVTAGDRETFDLAMQRLAGYLKAPHIKRILIIHTVAIIAAILAVLGILFGALRVSSIPVCKEAANIISCNTGLVHQLYTMSAKMDADWQKYLRTEASALSAQRKQEKQDAFLGQLKIWQSNLKEMRNELIPMKEFTPMEKILLASRGLLSIELQYSNPFAESLCDDLDSLCIRYDQRIHHEYNDVFLEEMIQQDYTIFKHCIHVYYYAYLSELSHVPVSARNAHQELNRTWNLFPTVSDIQSAGFYDELAQKEMNKVEQIIAGLRIQDIQQEGQLQEIEQQLDELDEKVKTFIEDQE